MIIPPRGKKYNKMGWAKWISVTQSRDQRKKETTKPMAKAIGIQIRIWYNKDRRYFIFIILIRGYSPEKNGIKTLYYRI
jgi:hypothetical protein